MRQRLLYRWYTLLQIYKSIDIWGNISSSYMIQVCPAYCVMCCEDIDLKRRISTWHIFLGVICNAVAVDAAGVLFLLFIYFYFLIFPILFCHIYIYIYRAFSLLAIWCLGPRVQILHSAEEHNLSPFDLNIACLCQSIAINNNKYIYITRARCESQLTVGSSGLNARWS